MTHIDPETLWFQLPDSHTLCRAGGNGPDHPSQLYAIEKYLGKDFPLLHPLTFLDYGCGSATTLEALARRGYTSSLRYEGLDIIPKNVRWCQENFPAYDFKVNPSIHKIDELDQSFDVVYSRHVVDHMNSFEQAMDEHCRVAKKLVIAVFWVPMAAGDEHDIKHIVDQGKVYENEYTNSYSRKKVLEWIKEKEQNGWKLLELTEEVGVEVKGHDWVLVLERV